jgi:6-phosphogluconolactonase
MPAAPTDPGATVVSGFDHREERMDRVAHRARVAGLALILTVVPLAALARPAAAATPAGHVYVETNAASGNAVVAFDRDANGHLTYAQTVATGGLGIAPTSVGSQGAVAITPNERHLLAVNAGSDDVSIFDVTARGLVLADVQPVGDRPVSVAVHRRIVYVLNQGDDTIQGLWITDTGRLAPIAGSTRPLSTAGASGAEVAFSPNGHVLAVTEKATQTIDTYFVRAGSHRAVGPKVQSSAGATPFGFQFGPDGRLYVSEAPGSAVSSYDVTRAGRIGVVSASVPDLQAAACWLVVNADGTSAYVANAGSANVSQYAISSDGSLSLVGTGANGATSPGPVDLDLTDGGGFLYVLDSGSGAISAFSVVSSDGSLTAIAGPNGLAIGYAGLIAV